MVWNRVLTKETEGTTALAVRFVPPLNGTPLLRGMRSVLQSASP
jgi:hypothetical protein